MSVISTIELLQSQLNQSVLGQQALVDKMLIALLANGHLIVEGAPGLAKTRAIRRMADCIDASFQRIQFTPDLLPGDVTGSDIFRPEDGSFSFEQGPIFNNLVLADEINRAPAKVQSALLEAMAEGQVSVGKKTYSLPPLFLVMATQNPIEQEGTYPLPEAQLDRFMLFVRVEYPDAETEKAILALTLNEASQTQTPPKPLRISQETVFSARDEVLKMHMADNVRDYIVQLVVATRNPSEYSQQLADAIEFGASPRATIALDRCARAHAWLHGKDYVAPDDVMAIAHDVLRHRIVLSFSAEAHGLDSDKVIEQLLHLVPVA